MKQTDWIAIDTQPGRAEGWLLRGTDVLTQTRIDAPVAAPSPSDAAPLVAAMRTALSAPVDLPILIDGLALRPVPVPGKPAELVPQPLPGLTASALPPLAQTSPSTGLLLGGVARLTGFFALNPRWDGVIVMTGPVTHWVQVSADEVVSFQSALSAALAGALTQAGLAGGPIDWDESAFNEALDSTLSRPERLASGLAALQAAGQLGQVAPEAMAPRLSGLLTGAELAATRPYWLGQQIAVLGETTDARPYVTALERQGVPCLRADPVRLALTGLIAHRRRQTAAAQDDETTSRPAQ
ncbi:2-dehydro-3-deoxygalactonokinase [Pseudodonghicola xiamenensis]|uniref:2-keto-3-deoxy-galactonokinase n=1 Tax=Pseudodonghicola xiamenensis TaxID=337702 RepID=A0A8J3MCT3_9RHOB|nr:2-dehydro-3-deoxygalactonokinase [Pseudodonghicola xiamenensis]GHG93691.1 2-keto-3-deoxy-galactonokinase [Pseudodonghicola xiamenensis]